MRYKGGDTAVRERYDRYIGAIELQYSRYRDMRYKGEIQQLERDMIDI